MNNYDKIISTGLSRGWNKRSAPCYVEMHHILPRCMGGTDEKTNLVCLTAKEHYMAHYYLTIMYPHNSKLIYAFHLMHTSSKNQDRYIDAELYEVNKKKFAKISRDRLIGIKQSESHINNRTLSRWSSDGAREKQAAVARESTKKVDPESRRIRMLGDKNPIHKIRRNGFNNPSFKMFYKTDTGIYESPDVAAKVHNISDATLRKRCRAKINGYSVILKSDIIYYN